MPRFLNRTLKPRIPITAKNMVVGPGLSVLMAHLLWHICNEGDGVVMTTVSKQFEREPDDPGLNQLPALLRSVACPDLHDIHPES